MKGYKKWCTLVNDLRTEIINTDIYANKDLK